MKARNSKRLKRICSLLLSTAIIVCSTYQEPILAENIHHDVDPLSAALQMQHLEIDVDNNPLNGKYNYEDVQLTNYKDAILATLDSENTIVEEINKDEGFYKNEANSYGKSHIIHATACALCKTIVAETEIKIEADSITTGNDDNCIIYSKTGNIEFSANDINFNGIIYAPEGSVILSGKNIHIDGALIAKNIVIKADTFDMQKYSDMEMQKLSWIQDSKINSNYITIDGSDVILHCENYNKTDIYIKKECETEFQLLGSTTETEYHLNETVLDGKTEIRTSAEKYGETYLSLVFTLEKTEEGIEESFLDSDGDGIEDGYEIWDLGTNPYLADTDGDGIADGYEVFVLHSDPLTYTEDKDTDGDELSDLKEMEMGTNPYLIDSDFDGIIDAEDSEPLVTNVEKKLSADYNVDVTTGVFDDVIRYYDEDGAEFEVIYNYVSGESKYQNEGGIEYKRFYDHNGNQTAEIQLIDGEYVVQTYSYDENGNKTSMANNEMRYDYTYDENSNVIKTEIGNRVLEESVYSGEDLIQTTFGNGDTQKQIYDDSGNLIQVLKNDEIAYEWSYENDKVVSYADYENDKNYSYEYDAEGYLIKTEDSDGFATEYLDNGVVQYSYNEEVLKKVIDASDEEDEIVQVAISYDDDTYVAKVEDNTLETHFETKEDTVVAENELKISEGAVVEEEVNDTGTVEYEYDASNNIKEIKEDGSVTATYEYDSMNQVIRENSAETGKTIVNEYDAAGNILSTTEYELNFNTPTAELKNGDTSEYSYADAEWKDLLTAYDGNQITYDEIGNPLVYYNGMHLEWNGKQLKSIHGEKNISYEYDLDGIRTSKDVDGVHTDYYWENDNLIGESRGNDFIWYMYDANGKIAGFQSADKSYYFKKNLQGDVEAILDVDGNCVVEYDYDAWGNVTGITGDQELGESNAIRYRGYYFDSETGFYYLQYRYYDTNTKRFLNTDDRLDFEAGIAENNLFTYAANNSVSRVDVNGHDSVVSVMIGIVLLTLVYVIAWQTVRFMSNWLKSADKIADAMVRNLKKIARTLSAEEAIAKVLWRKIGESFAKAKKKLTGRQCHHIIARNDHRAKIAKDMMQKAGISVEDSKNKVWLKRGLHARLHTDVYYLLTSEVIKKSYNMTTNTKKRKKNVSDALTILKSSLLALNEISPF